MQTLIIGAGAMGCLFGGLLAEAGKKVQLLDRWQEHVDVLNRRGLTIVTGEKERTVAVQAFTDPDQLARPELIIIFVKHGQTGAAARIAATLLQEDTVVLTLQNGMGNGELIGDIVGRERVICGTTAQGAMRLGPGRIQHSGTGQTIIGYLEQRDSTGTLPRVAELFGSASIDTGTSDNILPVLWNKLLVNVGINAITALTGIRNGQLTDLELTRKLAGAAVLEARAVAGRLGIKTVADPVNHVLEVARATAANRSSMGQDVDHRRKTEIMAINGYVVAMAKQLGMEVPVNTTLTALIRTLEEHYR